MNSGKYNFPGIRKAGAAALTAALVGIPFVAKIMASAFRPIVDMILGFISEWLANRGLLIINVGAIYVNGELDQAAFDKAFDEALSQAQAPGLTDAQKKVIDDQVIKAFRAFAHITK